MSPGSAPAYRLPRVDMADQSRLCWCEWSSGRVGLSGPEPLTSALSGPARPPTNALRGSASVQERPPGCVDKRLRCHTLSYAPVRSGEHEVPSSLIPADANAPAMWAPWAIPDRMKSYTHMNQVYAISFMTRSGEQTLERASWLDCQRRSPTPRHGRQACRIGGRRPSATLD